ncbi:CapA family protein [Aquimarina sediminis]|uniref:CapA family protein n=1 Tax=Aquimarina sediminis TaxID=2070536 RepID=UPI000CA0853A|nr:CapA family protein [Aquimarina sediminis]
MKKYFIVRDAKKKVSINIQRVLLCMPFLILFFGGLIVFSCNTAPKKELETVKIIFTGDLLLDRGVRERIEHLGIDNLFDATIDSVFLESDIIIANLECPATKIMEPINKQFIFRAEPEWLSGLKEHKITHLNMANNHAMDQGRKGLVDTEKNILNNGLIPLGYGTNLEKACKAQLITDSPRKIYVLSSLQVPSENWPFLENKPCVCEESFDEIAIRIKKLKKIEPNSVVIIQLHWGAEHTTTPLTIQKQQARKLIDSGADAIIGHHSHTIQSIETYNEKQIYYSLGNFIFDQSNPINSKGLMVEMVISESKTVFNDITFDIEKCVPKL